jgi:hypothetical protein
VISGNSRARECVVADIIVILSVVYLALVTWSCVAGFPGMPYWKCHLAVLATMVLALSALTRQLYWAATFRLLTAAWIATAPFLLSFPRSGPLPLTYLIIGGVITAASLPVASSVWMRRDNRMSVSVETSQVMLPVTSPEL